LAIGYISAMTHGFLGGAPVEMETIIRMLLVFAAHPSPTSTLRSGVPLGSP
jgi:hypothetical protein